MGWLNGRLGVEAEGDELKYSLFLVLIGVVGGGEQTPDKRSDYGAVRPHPQIQSLLCCWE